MCSLLYPGFLNNQVTPKHTLATVNGMVSKCQLQYILMIVAGPTIILVTALALLSELKKTEEFILGDS